MIVILYLWICSETSVFCHTVQYIHPLYFCHMVGQLKHIGGHCVYKVISVHLCALLGTTIVST